MPNADSSPGPIRVLHSIGSLNAGGIETWLMNLVRQNSPAVHFDFIVEVADGVYEAEAVRLGCVIHHHPSRSRLRKRLEVVGLVPASQFLARVLAAERYDVFHVHGEEFMGDAVRVAAASGVPVRVVHCHGTALARGKRNLEMSIRRRRFATLDRARILRHATDMVACSDDSGRFLLGGHWERDPRCRPLYCGVPLGTIRAAATQWTREAFRTAHGIPVHARVVGHAGSMGPTLVKNHGFLLDIFTELARRDPRAFLFLAGDGPLRSSIGEAVRARGLESRVAMPGVCRDVPALMVHGFDAHLLPSLREGLPVAGLEAVAAGLFTVCSDTITRDFTGAFPDRVLAVPLAACASAWARRVEEAFERKIRADEGLALVGASPFSIEASLAAATSLYMKRLHATGLNAGPA